MVIRANYRKMNDRLKRLYEIANATEEEIQRMVDLVDNLQIFWDGYANEEYLIKFDTDMGHASILLEKLKDTAILINNALEKYQRCEQEIAMKISSM